MSATAPDKTKGVKAESPWNRFQGALWQKEINVRAFIQLNYTPYDGDDSFLAPATERSPMPAVNTRASTPPSTAARAPICLATW